MKPISSLADEVRWLVPGLQWSQVLCLAWITWLPVSHGEILYPALAGVLGSSVALIVLQRLSVPGELRWMAGIYYALVAVLVLSAFARGNPGAAHQAALWTGVPLIWGAWALTLRGDHLRRTLWTLVLSTVVTGLVVVWLGVHALGAPRLFPAPLMEIQQMWFTVAASTQIEMHYMGLSSLIGLAVLTISLASLPGRLESLPPIWLIRVAAALAFVSAVASGRRGLTVVAVLAPLLCVAWAIVLITRHRWEGASVKSYWRDAAIGATCVALLALSPLGPNLTSLVGAHSGVIDWSGVLADDGGSAQGSEGSTSEPPPPPSGGEVLDADEDAIRIDQASELIEHWRERPVIGHGLGAVLDTGFERDPARPWMFENQPLQVLMNIGLAGCAVLAVLGLLMLRLMRRAWAVGTHHRLLVASGLMVFLMLLANATNPYLAAPGHGWVVFMWAGVCAAALSPGSRRGTISDGD